MDVADYMFPIFPYNAMPYISAVPDTAPIFLVLPYGSCAEEYKACLKANPNVVVSYRASIRTDSESSAHSSTN